MSAYDEVVTALERRGFTRMDFDIEKIRDLMDVLGSPQRAYYFRSSQYGTIDKIEKTDDYTIRITTKGPVAPFYHFLADTIAGDHRNI